MRRSSGFRSCSKLSLAIALATPACALDFDRLGTGSETRHDAGALDAGITHDTGTPDANLDANSDAELPASDAASPGTDSQVPEKICTADALRCTGSTLERCSESGERWHEQEDCGDNSCNPATSSCHLCAAAVSDDGVLACAVERAQPSGAAIASVSTAGASDAAQGSCGGTGSPDRVVEWIAPSTGYFTLDTRGSDFDTVLYARDCACDGAEIGCNGDAAGGGTTASDFVAHFDRGQRVAVFIDGNAGDSGNAVLNAQPVTCPRLDLDPANLPATFTDSADDGVEAFRFTPTKTALYSMRAGVPAGAKLCLQDGPRCGGAERACNTSGNAYGAEVLRVLTAGEPMTLVVSLVASGASFELNVQEVVDAVCEDTSVFDDTGTAHLADADHYLSSSCAPAGRVSVSLEPYSHPEARFGFDYGGIGAGCGVRITSNFYAVAYLLREDCGGVEVDCELSTYDAASGSYQVTVGPPISADPVHYTVVVEDASTGNVLDPSFTWSSFCVL